MSQQQPFPTDEPYAPHGAPSEDPRVAAWPAGPVPMTPADQTTWATLGHLAWVAGSFVGVPPLGPLVTYLVLKDRGPYVRHHNAQALNFQLSVFLYALAATALGGVLAVVTLGLAAPLLVVLVVAIGIAGIVLSVLAAVAASRGQWYRYPLTIQFVR